LREKFRVVAVATALIAFAACATDEDDEDQSSSPTSCHGLAEEACLAEGCEGLHGRDVDGTKFVECRFKWEDELCNTVITCAYPPNAPSECLLFGTNCVPAEWVKVTCETETCPK